MFYLVLFVCSLMGAFTKVRFFFSVYARTLEGFVVDLRLTV